MTPISVHRAVSCPDGTTVSVQGIVVRASDGTTMLCDAVAEFEPAKCAGDTLVLSWDDSTDAPPQPETQRGYVGTVNDGAMSVTWPPPFVDDFPQVVVSRP
jgi:hypothetical protein